MKGKALFVMNKLKNYWTHFKNYLIDGRTFNVLFKRDKLHYGAKSQLRACEKNKREKIVHILIKTKA